MVDTNRLPWRDRCAGASCSSARSARAPGSGPFTGGFLAAAASVAVASVAATWGVGALVVVLRRSLGTELRAVGLGLAASLVVLGAFATQMARLLSVPPIYQVTTGYERRTGVRRHRGAASRGDQPTHIRPRPAHRRRHARRGAASRLAGVDESPIRPRPGGRPRPGR